MPAEGRGLRQVHACFDALLIEQAQFDSLGELGEEGEVGAGAIECGTWLRHIGDSVSTTITVSTSQTSTGNHGASAVPSGSARVSGAPAVNYLADLEARAFLMRRALL